MCYNVMMFVINKNLYLLSIGANLWTKTSSLREPKCIIIVIWVNIFQAVMIIKISHKVNYYS